MKKIIFSVLFLLPMIVMAEVKEVKVPVYVRNSYFACSYLESLTSSYLQDFGAKDIRVRCSGGLPDSEFATVTASFDAPSIEDANTEWKTLSYRNRRDENCKLNTILINKLVKSFEVTKMESRNSCMDGQGRYNFDIVILGYE